MSSQQLELVRWFAKEVEPHEVVLRRWLMARFPSLRDADDLLQEAYVRLLRARETSEITHPRAFLFVAVRNLALNRLRRLRSECPQGTLYDEGTAVGVPDDCMTIPDAISRAEDLQILTSAIASLPDRCREIIILRKYHGLSQKEVAERLGISEHTVESQGVIGLRKCITYFRRHGYKR